MAELCANYETGLLYLTADGFIEGTPTVVGAGDLRVRATCQTAKGEQTYQVAGAIPEGRQRFCSMTRGEVGAAGPLLHCACTPAVNPAGAASD